MIQLFFREEGKVKKTWTLQNYFMAVVDIQGQSETILATKRIPLSESEKQEARIVLANTAGYVMQIRQYFIDFFKQRTTGILDSLPSEQKLLAESWKKTDLIVRSFSDTVTISVPLSRGSTRPLPMASVYAALYALCGAYVVALSIGKPIRCGVDVGPAVELPTELREVYGTALVRAHRLESSVAKYPRIAVGDSLIEFLDSFQNQPPKLLEHKIEQQWARDCRSLIIDSQDDTNLTHMLDVIGPAVHSIPNFISSDWVKKGYDFIIQSQLQFQKQSGNKLAPRYQSLCSYYESRLGLWYY
jgi:hypothetical protein